MSPDQLTHNPNKLRQRRYGRALFLVLIALAATACNAIKTPTYAEQIAKIETLRANTSATGEAIATANADTPTPTMAVPPMVLTALGGTQEPLKGCETEPQEIPPNSTIQGVVGNTLQGMGKTPEKCAPGTAVVLSQGTKGPDGKPTGLTQIGQHCLGDVLANTLPTFPGWFESDGEKFYYYSLVDFPCNKEPSTSK